MFNELVTFERGCSTYIKTNSFKEFRDRIEKFSDIQKSKENCVRSGKNCAIKE